MAKTSSRTGVSPWATRSRTLSAVFWAVSVMVPPAGGNGRPPASAAGRRPSSPVADEASAASGARATVALLVEGRVQGERRVDQRQVGERLREVADLLAGEGDLLGVEPHVGGVGEHVLQRRPGVVQPAGAGEGVDVGERAQREGALRAA